ncbi:MAG: hypothetical protein M5U14_01205 [Acidimicrobiia bacterium]|nr:hypothetical protein [Acidimicrobiia bacterium]
MPNGVVAWFDPKTGDARVVRGGHEFPAREEDIETAARAAGARVHFDIRRESGVERAANVRLRAGTRVSPTSTGSGTSPVPAGPTPRGVSRSRGGAAGSPAPLARRPRPTSSPGPGWRPWRRPT